MYALTPEIVIEWNAAFGGALLDRGRLNSALARPLHTFGGKPLYPDTMTQAAALLHALCLDHPFIDGNKRTAWKSCTVFLAAQGITIDADAVEAGEIVVAVANKSCDLKGINEWLNEHRAPPQ